MSNLSYLFAAYAIIWLAVFFYLFGMSRKRARLEEELKELKRLLLKGDLPGRGDR